METARYVHVCVVCFGRPAKPNGTEPIVVFGFHALCSVKDQWRSIRDKQQLSIDNYRVKCFS